MGLLDFFKPIKKTAKDYFESGVAKYQLNDFIGSIADFTKVIELNPTYSQAYFNRGKINVDLKYYSTAICDFDKIIELEPCNWEAYFYRGFLRYQEDYYSGAFSDLKEVIGNRITNKEALILFEKVKCILYTEKQKNLYLLEPEKHVKNRPSFEEIERELDEINRQLDIKPNRFGPNYAKKLNIEAYNFFAQGLFSQGIESVKSAIRNNNMQNSGIKIKVSPSIYLNSLALGYLYIGDYDKALITINKCIEIDEMENSNNPEHYTTRAKINLRLKNEVKSIKDLKMKFYFKF